MELRGFVENAVLHCLEFVDCCKSLVIQHWHGRCHGLACSTDFVGIPCTNETLILENLRFPLTAALMTECLTESAS